MSLCLSSGELLSFGCNDIEFWDSQQPFSSPSHWEMANQMRIILPPDLFTSTNQCIVGQMGHLSLYLSLKILLYPGGQFHNYCINF